MTQKTVQLVIGRILTDEEFRDVFLARPVDTLVSLRNQGYDLTNGEVEALVQTDVRLWQHGRKWLDGRLQRSRLTPASPSESADRDERKGEQ